VNRSSRSARLEFDHPFDGPLSTPTKAFQSLAACSGNRALTASHFIDQPLNTTFATHDQALGCVYPIPSIPQENTMKIQRNILIAALLVASTSSAFSQSGLTRAQVKAELQEAIRNGDILFGDRGETLREIYPSRYPAKVQQPGKTREQVRKELQDAIASGDIVDGGDLALARNELRPDLYPTKPKPLVKTRAEVRAELAEAIRTGNIQGNGDRSEPLNVLFPHRYPKDASTNASSKPLP